MIMKPGLRKMILTLHITSSVGWIGAVVGFLVLVGATLLNQDVQTVRAAFISMELIGWFAIIPFSVASLLSGIVMSLGTKWGLFRHFWVLFKLLLTILAIVILILNMQTVSILASLSIEKGNVDLGGAIGELIHAGGGLLVLLVITILSVYKPRGMTKYGLRKHLEQSSKL